MCTCFFVTHPPGYYDFILCFNRDEFFARPTESLHSSTSTPGLFFARDLKKGGTWLGARIEPSPRSLRVGFLTSFRRPRSAFIPEQKSRGHLVTDYLHGSLPAASYGEKVLEEKDQYNGFNLVVGNMRELYYISSELDQVKKLENGFYGLSNGILGCDWPKVRYGEARFRQEIETSTPEELMGRLFRVMQDSSSFADDELPETGVGLELERFLSPIFIQPRQGYGTRSTTVLLFAQNGQSQICEWQYEMNHKEFRTKKYSW